MVTRASIESGLVIGRDHDAGRSPELQLGLSGGNLRRELVVGTDGVKARVGPKGWHEVRFDDVTQVAVRDGEVVFLASGTEAVMRIPLDMGDRELAAAVGRRIERAFARFGEVGQGKSSSRSSEQNGEGRRLVPLRHRHQA